MVLVQRSLAIGGVLLFVIAGACGRPAAEQASIATPTPTIEASPTAAASPSIAPTSSPTPTPAGTPRVETSSIVLDLAIGPGYEQPAATTPGVGGLTSRGPTSLAVDGQGRIYLWDHARFRILVYEGSRLANVLPQPFVEEGSTSLLAYAGRLYLRWAPNPIPFAEYEIDATTGQLLRLGTGLYPRERPPTNMYESSGPNPPMGADPFGNTFRRSFIPTGHELRRVDPSGTAVAIATSAVNPSSERVQDTYVAADGAVYDLIHRVGSAGRVERIRIVRMLGAAGTPAPEAAPAITEPRFAGHEAPASIEVLAAPELPPGTIAGADARSLWWLFSYSRTDPYYDTIPFGTSTYRMKATWPDGRSLAIELGAFTLAGTARFGTSSLLDRALPHVMSRPSFVIDALRRHGARIRIADLTDVERELTAVEVDELVAALGSAFPTSFFERYQDLEDPFPRRQLSIAYPGGTVVLQDVGDRYLRTGRLHRGAMVHDGRAATLLRQWLPTPSFARDDPAILYTATKVTLPDQDISRWKAGIVRALVLGPAAGNLGGGTSYDTLGPLVFAFTLPGGRTEVVRVDAKGFTFAGRVYERTGLLDLHGYRGVP